MKTMTTKLISERRQKRQASVPDLRRRPYRAGRVTTTITMIATITGLLRP